MPDVLLSPTRSSDRGFGAASSYDPAVPCSHLAPKIGHREGRNANPQVTEHRVTCGVVVRGWPDLNRRPLRREHGVSGNDELTLPATDGLPGQSHASEPRDGLRTGMADMGTVRDTCI